MATTMQIKISFDVVVNLNAALIVDEESYLKSLFPTKWTKFHWLTIASNIGLM